MQPLIYLNKKEKCCLYLVSNEAMSLKYHTVTVTLFMPVAL
uniref:Uncharacterized protein n=1 Tax=Anguilla anguilla TaxID=7936 RepID=A0A0E9UI09_ANGAN